MLIWNCFISTHVSLTQFSVKNCSTTEWNWVHFVIRAFTVATEKYQPSVYSYMRTTRTPASCSYSLCPPPKCSWECQTLCQFSRRWDASGVSRFGSTTAERRRFERIRTWFLRLFSPKLIAYFTAERGFDGDGKGRKTGSNYWKRWRYVYALFPSSNTNLMRLLSLSEIRRTIQSKFLIALLAFPSPENVSMLFHEGWTGWDLPSSWQIGYILLNSLHSIVAHFLCSFIPSNKVKSCRMLPATSFSSKLIFIQLQLIGPPGVGKTAILEGLASRIVSKEVPEVCSRRDYHQIP